MYDVEMSGRVLRVMIDTPEGASLDTCARFSRALSDELDYRDLMPGKYFLEVSSPGIERSLRRPSDFVRAVGTTVKVVTTNGAVEGRLVAADEQGIGVELPPEAGAAETRWIDHAQVKRARTRVSDDELFAGSRDRRQSSKRKDE